jgi:peptide/nickel transport system substrate-binding protein
MTDNDTSRKLTDEQLRKELSDEDLSGPRIDRRMSLKLLSTAGLTALAGCSGGGNSESNASGGGDGGGGSGGGEANDSGTASSEGPAGQAAMGGRADVIWHIASIENLDPAFADHGHYVMLLVNIFNGLIRMDENFEFEPDLAKDWTVDGTTFTFQLREGVKFHNGTDFTAEDVKFTLTRNIQQEAPAASFISENIVPPSEGGVVVKNDYEVEINWKQPTASGLAYMTRGPGRVATIINQEALEEMGQQQYTLTPVGTGPFEVTEHVAGESITFDKFGNYWESDESGTSLPYLDGIDLSIVPEASTATSAIQSGDVHLLNVVPGESVTRLRGRDDLQVGSQPMPGWYGLEMNMTKEPFSSRNFRRGVAKLIDNERWVDTSLFGNAIADTGPLSPVHVGRDEKPADQNYAPEEGKRLIRESGFEGAEFSILARGTEVRQAKVMRQILNESGVLNIEVEQVPVAEFGKQIDGMTYDTWIGGQLLSVDPALSLKPFYTEDGIWNWTGYSDEQVAEWLAEQANEMDPQEREKLLWKVEDKVIADAPHAYLCHPQDWTAMTESLKDVGHASVLRLFHEAYLTE